MLLLRSLVFQAWFFVSATVFAMLVFLSWPLPYPVRYGLTRTWARGMLWAGRFFCGLDYTVEGLENVPDRPSVILSKHSTVFEAYALITYLPRQTWVAKRELSWIPVFGWGFAALKPITIDRKGGGSAVAQVISQGKARLAEGTWVTVFPEGTRLPPGETRRYGISGAALARDAGCPIVPVAHNAGEFWPRRSVIKRPGLIRLCVGPPIEPAGRTPKQTNLVVQEWIQAKMAEICGNAASS
ncbi:MAG TPA: lysophospholipid acyltransferase family protein [Woeseiaceae bacterium]|nr:lysophospholipid acyltransferase family protein [Woeseiaceae bacterium]